MSDQSLVECIKDSQENYYLNLFNGLNLHDLDQIKYRVSEIPENYLNDEKFLVKLVRNNPNTFQFIPIQTNAIIDAAIKKYGSFIFRHIKPEFLTYELCFKMIKKSNYVLRYVPDQFKTYELCLLAFKTQGASLHNVPEIHKTYELCLLAMKHKGKLLKLVPEEIRDLDMCLTAVENDSDKIAFSRVPICPNQTHEETLFHLTKMKNLRDNKNLVKTTIGGLANDF